LATLVKYDTTSMYLSIFAELAKISHKFTSIVYCWPLLFIVKLHSVRNNAYLTYSRNRHRGCARARINRDDFATSFLYLRARKKYLLLLFSVLLILLLFVLSYTHTLSLALSLYIYIYIFPLCCPSNNRRRTRNCVILYILHANRAVVHRQPRTPCSSRGRRRSLNPDLIRLYYTHTLIIPPYKPKHVYVHYTYMHILFVCTSSNNVTLCSSSSRTRSRFLGSLRCSTWRTCWSSIYGQAIQGDPFKCWDSLFRKVFKPFFVSRVLTYTNYRFHIFYRYSFLSFSLFLNDSTLFNKVFRSRIFFSNFDS